MKTPPLTRSPRLALLAAISTGIATTVSLHAQTTETWVGNTDALWSTSANWSTTAPVNGDSVVFDAAGTAGTTLNNDISSLSLATMTFNAAASAYTIGGNDLTLTSGITDNATNAQTVSTNIALGAANAWSVATGGTLTVSGGVSGTGFGITKSGAGTLVLSGSNTYTGATAISAGTMEFQGAAAMSTGSALSMSNGTTLSLKADTSATFAPSSFTSPTGGSTYNISVASINGVATGNTLSIKGPGSGGGSTSNTTLNVSGTAGAGYGLKFTTVFSTNSSSGSAWTTGSANIINMTNADVTLDAGLNMGNNGDGGISVASTTGNTLTLNGTVTANNNRTMYAIVNSGTLTLNNTVSANTGQPNWGFFVILNGGTLNVNSAGAISNNANIGGPGSRAGFTIAGGTLDNTSGSAKTLTSNPTVGFNGDFAFSTSGGTSANNLNLGTGATYLGTAAAGTGATRTITTNGSATLTVGGVITSNGATPNNITKAGTGTLVLSGNSSSTYLGATTVNGGTLKVNGNISGGTGVTINGSGATLAGTGTVSGITLTSGTITPGDGGIGTLTASSLDWAGGNTLAFDLSGVDSTADLLSLSGSLTKSGSGTYAFDFSGGLAGQTYTLINFGSNSGFSVGDFSVNSGISGTFGLSGTSLTFTAVPEPQEFALAIVGLLGVMIFVRRRVAHFGE
jgi:autotransporter-associated beta strand protein